MSRPRLQDLLDDNSRQQVTLVCGPPGAGKTTLLASSLGPCTSERPVAWLSLDQRDNDPGRLVALLRWALSSDQTQPVPMLSSAPLTDLLDDLLGQLTARDEPQILVLDDVHELRSPLALEAISHLLRYAPLLLDVVLSSRADPPVGLDRLRLDGRLGEIRNTDLAFSQTETAELLASHEVVLGSDDVRALWARTEGWAAGLRLAACTLQTERDPGRFVRSASQTETVVSDYLLRELLVRQDEAIQWFLMRTSVAERLTPELAIILSDDEQAPAYLEDLESSGIVVTECGDSQSYRYHSLFGALLRARLQRHDPELAKELHGRAAQWCLAQDLPLEAQRHAHAAADWDTLGRLVAWRWLDATLDGLTFTEDLLTTGIEAAALSKAPGLALVAAADACRRGDHEEATLYRDALDDLLAEAAPVDPDGVLSWDNERLVLDVTFGCAFGSDERARRASAVLASSPASEPAAASLRRFGALRGAQLALDAGEVDAAGEMLTDLADHGDQCWRTLEAGAFLALIHAASGRLGLAQARIDAVLDRSPDSATPQTAHAALLASALRLAQTGEQRNAVEAIAEAAPPADLGSRTLRMVDRLARAAVGATPFVSVRLDAATAQHPLAERALICLGVMAVVGSDGRPLSVGGPGERGVVEARERLVAEELGRSDEAVLRWLDGDTNGAHPRTMVEALTIAAIAAGSRGDHPAARRRLSEALNHVAATGTVAPLLRHGANVAPLLDRNLSELGDRTSTALGLLDRMRSTGTGGLVEPLTDREMEVLVHLPTLMSNAEIADGLHLSVNTVKTHLKAVYRKLGVDGRRQAVVRGRELELI